MWLLLIAAAVVVWVYARGLPGGAGSGHGGWGSFFGRPQAGQKAAPFSAVALDGRDIRFPADYADKFVLLDFWATWCGPCRAEFPHLRDAYARFHERGFEIVGVSLDQPRGIGSERVVAFLADQRAPWPVVYTGAAEIADAYRIEAIPSPFLIDGRTGRIVARGDALRGAALSRTLARLLDQR